MPYIDSFLAVLALAALHVLCGRMRIIHSVRHSNWLSFSGGVAVAYVFESLLPKLGEWQAIMVEQYQIKSAVPKLCEDLGIIEYCGGVPKFLNYEIFLLALAGLMFFLWLDWLAESKKVQGKEPKPGQAHSSFFWLHIGVFATYNVLIGYITVHNILPGRFILVLLTIAIGLHFFGINHTLWINYRNDFDRHGPLIFCVSLLEGGYWV